MVNPYIDPLWNTVLTGSGPVTQTYTGVLPTWYTQLPTVTGMFYANGRIYYTRSGQNSLYWRWFSPDSGIIGGVENTVAGGNITWSTTRGMFLDGSNLYVVSSTNGNLLRIGFANGAPTGTSTVADATTDWRGRAVFLASVLPNVAPTAGFTYECIGISCTFDAGTSTDGDGTIQSFEWTFSDGDEAGGPTPQKDFAATGTYDVTLTVHDDGGLSGSTTQQVSVVKPNVPPTAAFTTTCEYLDCDFDATDSVDSDGTVDGYEWDFGDGQTGTGATPEHTYESPGELRDHAGRHRQPAGHGRRVRHEGRGGRAGTEHGLVRRRSGQPGQRHHPERDDPDDRLRRRPARHGADPQLRQQGALRPDGDHRLDGARARPPRAACRRGSTPRSPTRPTRTRRSP